VQTDAVLPTPRTCRGSSPPHLATSLRRGQEADVSARITLDGARELRRTWKAVPAPRRLAMELRDDPPEGEDEALALAARGRYLAGWPGLAEWSLAGLVAIVVITAAYSGARDLPGGAIGAGAGFLAVWVPVGWMLRRARGNRLQQRAQATLEGS
jgi:hypothetical protein